MADNSQGGYKWLSKAFNLPVLEKSRMPWVDYLRGIAIVLVVYRHVLIGIERSGLHVPQLLVVANEIFFSFRMPLFFILSGLFVSQSLVRKKPGVIIESKFENLIYPYLVWAFLQITLQIILSGQTNANRTIRDYTLIFYQPRGLDQFWYLPALFNCSVIYILLKSKLRLPPLSQLLLGLVFYFAGPHFRQISMISDWMEFYLFFAIGDAIAGYFFTAKSQTFLNSRKTLLLIVPLFILAQWYFLTQTPISQMEMLLIALAGCLSMFVFAYHLQNLQVLSFLRVLGYHSLYIYVMHVIISACTRFVLMKAFGVQDASVLLAAGIITGVLIPVMLYNILIKQYLWFLFSYKKPHSKALS